MLNFTTIISRLAHICSGGRANECSPRTAALCAAICLTLLACSQPVPAPQPTPPAPLPATPSPAPLPATPLPPSTTVPPIAAQTTPSPTPTSTPAAQPIPAYTPSLPLPIFPPANVVFTQITVGANHACGLRENAAPLCWGEDPNAHGILDAPAQTDLTQISAGLNFTCALRQDGTIACWGDNSAGQATPPQGSFTEIAAGQNHACAIPVSQDAPPALICWGAPFPNGAETLPLDTPISDIQSGNNHTCGLTPQADIACLSINDRLTEITNGPFTQLAAGVEHICALREHGSAY